MIASMADLERRYREELDSLRLDGAAFARTHPKIAGQLALDAAGCNDPHVERLIESVAWLVARQSLDLDHKLPQLAQSLLERLYPQLTAPVPSCAIAAFDADPSQSEASAGLSIARGSELLCEHDGHTLRFRTTSELTLWPLETTSVELLPPASVEAMDGRNDVASVLKIALACQGKVSLQALRPKSLRFYLNCPRSTAAALYDLIVGDTVQIALTDDRGKTSRLPRSAITPVGFNPDEALFPTPPQALDAFRLLLEHASFMAKFFFFDLDLQTAGGLGNGRSLALSIGFARTSKRRLSLSSDAVRLGAVPVTNLFSRISEPLRIDHTRNSYRLEPDSRDPQACEVHSVREVWCRRQTASATDRIPALFDGNVEGRGGCHWHARRVPAMGRGLPGSDITISLSDLDLDPAKPASDVLFARLWCTSRGLAENVSGGTELSIERALPVERIGLLTRPSRQRPARLGRTAVWPLISQLSLNHLSLAAEQDGPATLKELLRLWGEEQAVEALCGIAADPAVRRLPDRRQTALVHGLDVTLTLDPDKLARAEASAMLFGSVLSHFFGRYVAANSFVALSLKNVIDGERIGAWPARAGELALI